MFNKSNKQEGSKYGSSAQPTTLIAEGTRLEGDLDFLGSLEVQGSVIGKITTADENAQVRVLNGGEVEGTMSAPTVVVNGHIKGDIFASKNARLAAKAVVEGNIYYNSLEIERGAHVAGNLVHEVPATNVSAIQQKNNTDGKQDPTPSTGKN